MESELLMKKSNSYANINDQLLNLVNIDIPKYLLEKKDILYLTSISLS